MKIEIKFTLEDLRTVLAEHCRKQFKVDPRNVDLPPELLDKKEFWAKVEGEYRPE